MGEVALINFTEFKQIKSQNSGIRTTNISLHANLHASTSMEKIHQAMWEELRLQKNCGRWMDRMTGRQAGRQVVMHACMHACRQTSRHAGRRPGIQRASHTASQPASQPCSKRASQPSRQPASQAARQPASQTDRMIPRYRYSPSNFVCGGYKI